MEIRKNKADVLLGLQWGDEGKGKIVDYLTPGYRMIARFQGGPNAGHTLEFEGEKFVLHTIPSGIFHTESVNLIGNGVVIDPCVFKKEIESTHISVDDLHPRLMISKKAHLILPSHKLLDAALEHSKGNAKIGSTLKGIGPAYTDKIARTGLRIGNIVQPSFVEKYNKHKAHHQAMAAALGFDVSGFKPEGMDFDLYEQQWLEGIEIIKKLQLVDSEILVNQELEKGTRILAEGAQGSLLDIDFGSYPFVTSSNTVAAGASTGLGIAPSAIGEVFGIFKAYCTRVGSGPFPTELFCEDGDDMRKEGNEFGSTTGRPRRCGWLDLPALKYAVMLSGVTKLIMTKADVLSIFDNIKVCIAYKQNNVEIDYLPFEYDDEKLDPVYHTLKGWKTDLRKSATFDELPNELKEFVKFVEDFVKVPVYIVSTGPDR
ncbi:MAG: adenylosuccinate synthase, partial [Bacteroidetes bacterium]